MNEQPEKLPFAEFAEDILRTQVEHLANLNERFIVDDPDIRQAQIIRENAQTICQLLEVGVVLAEQCNEGCCCGCEEDEGGDEG